MIRSQIYIQLIFLPLPVTSHTGWCIGSGSRKSSCVRIRRSQTRPPNKPDQAGVNQKRTQKQANMLSSSPSLSALTPSNGAISAAPTWFSPPMGGRALSPLGSRLAMASPTLRFPRVVAKKATSRENRTYRHERLRKKVEGTPERPRMSVFRSNKHLHVQVIDDTKKHTLAAASTMQKALSQEVEYSSGPTIEVAKKVGETIAKACLEKGITKVVFDRGGYLYHGRIQALADAARENGLEF
ncbi:50S ribosomal protein L18 [Rhynchospora pubera]|uniref:Large ribosomal subunit protein uL18c n=1 Tax=Rhynchospora pubera TaxID=906938 RepID=A0AAV8FTI2_9POAL|nr:50S ribosomal protein L18 [Rhynchospora pubera]